MTVASEEFIPTRRTLLSRLKNWDDQESWREFFNTYWKLIYSVALKAGFNEDEAEEVVQETVIAVARNIREFKYDPAVCSFKTWLLRLIRSRMVDQLRKRHREEAVRVRLADDTIGTPTLERLPDPASIEKLETSWDDEWERNLVALALEKIRQRVNPTHYQMFDLYVFKEWPVAEISRKFHVSVAQVYLARHRVGRLIKQEVRLEKEMERGRQLPVARGPLPVVGSR
jgi:RNA polymerase sigma-70 factor (ECF subfamily)